MLQPRQELQPRHKQKRRKKNKRNNTNKLEETVIEVYFFFSSFVFASYKSILEMLARFGNESVKKNSTSSID